MKKYFVILVLLMFIVNTFAITEFDKHISNAKVYYDTGEFDKVINELTQALNIVKKNNQKGMIEAYKYLAFSYVAYGNVDKAKSYFVEILKINPKFDLDRDLTSPKILAVFDQARIEYKKMIKEQKKKEAKVNAKASTSEQNEYYVPVKKKKKEKVVKKAKKVKKKKNYNFGNPTGLMGYSEKKGKKNTKTKVKKEKRKSELAKNTNLSKKSYIQPKVTPRPNNGKYYKEPTKFNAMWKSFILPGWGQLYKGQKAKGWVFIGSTAVLDIIYVLNTISVKNAYNDYEKYKIYNADYETEYWNTYNKVYGRYQLFVLIHLLFWTYNMTDATFLGWKKVNMSMDVTKKGTFMLTFKTKF